MSLPEVPGMTYAEFLKDRADAIAPDSMFDKAASVSIPVIKSTLISIPATLSALIPDSHFDNLFQNKTLFNYIEVDTP